MGQMETEYSVVCQTVDGAHFRIRVRANSHAAAIAAVAAQGHDARLATPTSLSAADQHRALAALRAPLTTCPLCGYALQGLPEDEGGRTTCPECGGWSGVPGPGLAEAITRKLQRSGIKLLLGCSVVLSLLEALRLVQSRPVPVLAALALAIAILIYATSGRRRGRAALLLAIGVLVAGLIRVVWP